MTVRVTVDQRNKKVLLDLAHREEKHKRAIADGLKLIGKISVDYTRQIINSGSKTGRKYKTLPNQSSAPYQAPATQTGRLAASASYVANGADRLEVGESVPYAKFLEDGTKRMKPRLHLVVTANEKAGEALEILERLTKERVTR